MEAKQIQTKIIEACKRLYQKNMLASTDGNMSFKLSNEQILITPAGVSKAYLEPSQFAIIDQQGNTLQGNPSSEKLMHLEVYKNCADALCVVHAHPPHAMAWSMTRPSQWEQLVKTLPEVLLDVGNIPIAPFATPATKQMGQNLIPFLPQNRAIILAHHGAVTWGSCIDSAVNAMERIEHAALILTIASSLKESK